MKQSIYLPNQAGETYEYKLAQTEGLKISGHRQFSSRVAYSAAHVVADPFRSDDPVGKPTIDWDLTMKYRHYLWSLGFSVAEAMDTAQGGMGVRWGAAEELSSRSAKGGKRGGCYS